MNNTEFMSTIKSGWHITEVITDPTSGGQKIYRGRSKDKTGGGEDLPVWQILRTSIDNTTREDGKTVQTIIEGWADGDMDFDNVWADRASLEYKYL